MSIDIDQLTEAELVDLNRGIVERMRFLHQMRTHATMLKFSIGDRVRFDTDDFRTITGTLVRYNKKNVTVVTDDGHRWNVLPSFLRLTEPKDITPATKVLSAHNLTCQNANGFSMAMPGLLFPIQKCNHSMRIHWSRTECSHLRMQCRAQAMLRLG